MPIDTEQWRASIGQFLAARVPLPCPSYHQPNANDMTKAIRCFLVVALLPLKTVVFYALWTLLQLSSLVCHAAWLLLFVAKTTHQKLRGGIPILLALCLVVSMLLLIAGDVERNPGPPKIEARDPILKDLVHLKVQSEWRDLGIQLGVPKYTLSIIESDHASISEKCLIDMFDWWLKSDPDATYEKLVQALIAIKRSDVADILSNKYYIDYSGAGALGMVKIPFTDLEFWDELGGGAQSSVYKGKRLSTNTVVAIKRVAGKIREREAEIHSKLDHQNIIQLYGVVDRRPDSFFVLEFARGGSLYDRIHKQHYRSDHALSLKWAKEIAEGMNYLHQKKILHRDLKSANVLLTADSTTKLCDFGSAVEYDSTKTRTVTGTFRWMAPEVLLKSAVSFPCDVFSYGMVLYEIFMFALPFADISEFQVAMKVLDGERPAIPPSCEPELARLLERCWEANPKNRPDFSEILLVLSKGVGLAVEGADANVQEGKQLFNLAMQCGYVESVTARVLLLGPAGSGKTASKALILGLPPAEVRVSTGAAERNEQIVHLVQDDELVIVGPEEVKMRIAAIISNSQWVNTDQAATLSSPAAMPVTQPPASPEQCMDCTPVQSSLLPTCTSGTTDEETTPIASLPEASSIEEDLIKFINSAVVHDSVALFRWVDFLDTGGQPEFFEVFRAFLKHTSICMLVHNLSMSLDARPIVEYFGEDGRPLGTPYIAAITHEQILSHSFRMQKNESLPKLIVVGTHADLMCTESREEINRRLIQLLPPENVLYSSQERRDIIFPLNARSPGEADIRVAREIRQIIIKQCQSQQPYKIPLGWYVLEKSLQEVAQKLGRHVLTKEECFAVALRLHFSMESFEASLLYLHNLDIISYYANILPEIVFCNPLIPLYKVTELVKMLRQCESDLYSGPWKRFSFFGLITEEILGSFHKHYSANVFTPKILIKLLRELLIVVSMNDGEYLMPALLQSLSQDQLQDHRIASVSFCTPLVIYFQDGLPFGVFCSLIVFLLSHENYDPWTLQSNSTGRPTCLSRNCIKFTIAGMPGSVTLIDTFDFIEVHVCVPHSLLPMLCPVVQRVVFAGLHKIDIVLNYNLKPLSVFICPCDRSSYHFAFISNDQRYWICSEDSDVFGDLGEKHRIWLANVTQPISSSASYSPTTPEPTCKSSAGTALRADELLNDGDHFDITSNLIDLDRTTVYNLGMALGLNQRKVKMLRDSDTFLDDVIAAWLRQEDYVDKRGMPTWRTLVRALRHPRIGQAGVADMISRDRGL